MDFSTTSKPSDASKYPIVLTQQPSKSTSGAATKVPKEVEPEVITADEVPTGLVAHEDGVGAAHPEAAVKSESCTGLWGY